VVHRAYPREGELRDGGAWAQTAGILAKQKSLSATEREQPRIQAWREKFRARLGALTPTRLVFVDEAGTHVAMTREWARGPLGQRVVDRVPRKRGTVLTLIGAMDLAGVRALMTVEGGTSGDVFLTVSGRGRPPSPRIPRPPIAARPWTRGGWQHDGPRW
jgi:hypothetical protein